MAEVVRLELTVAVLEAAGLPLTETSMVRMERLELPSSAPKAAAQPLHHTLIETRLILRGFPAGATCLIGKFVNYITIRLGLQLLVLLTRTGTNSVLSTVLGDGVCNPVPAVGAVVLSGLLALLGTTLDSNRPIGGNNH